MRFMRSTVMYSHSRGVPGGKVSHYPFAFLPSALAQPSVFEVDFLIGEVRYQFGFEVNGQVFPTEWLFSFPEGKRRKMYFRQGGDVEFGASMKGQKKLLVELMRSNSLFLSTATQNDHEELTKVRGFFERMEIDSEITRERVDIEILFQKTEIDDRVIEILRKLGTGIVGYDKSEKKLSESALRLRAGLADLFKSHVSEEFDFVELSENDNDVEIKLAHEGVGEEKHLLDVSMESAGTRRLLVLLTKVFIALENGSLLIIDELDASLHTIAAETVISLFDDPNLNKKNAQLIATTHDTNLLSSDFLQRDQIWLMEKNHKGSTEFYSVLDFKTRQADNLEAAYLAGRFGATIPSLVR
jgi:hypothetical protein